MKDRSLEIKRWHKQVVCKKPKKRGRGKKKMAMMHDLYDQIDLATSAKYRAEEVLSRLSTKHPSFMKPMIRSNVSGGFWLSLPRLFCQLHMPRHDIAVTLVDESQDEYKTKYLAERNGLSGGWRGFSLAHDLVEGDVLVFQLFRFCELKVYIVRANYLAEVDAALVLLRLYAHQKQVDPGLAYETLSIVDAVKAGKLNDAPSGFSSWKMRPTEIEQLEIRPFSGGYSI
ncbi:B3 domain-containing protein [Capsicum annuum]|nr:B3 domain-containing protein [Capsicum annuum]